MGTLYDRVEFALGVTLLAVITALVFVAAVMRFAGSPIIWSVDLAQLLFIWVCFIGATRAMRQKAHLGVDFFVQLLPQRIRLIVETLLASFFIAFLLVLAFEGYKLTMLNWERVFGDSGLSYAWVTIAVPAGSILLSMSIFANLIDAWRRPGTLVYTRTTDTGDVPPSGLP
ncbi:MAG: TRAP transporter small permease [Sulfitobacter sp.]